MWYAVIFFDVGNTLVRYVPSEEEQFLKRLADSGYEGASVEDAHRMVIAAQNAEYAQLLREWRGETRLSDDAFFALQDCAALQELLPREEALTLLPALSAQKRSYDGKQVLPEARMLLQKLKARGQRMGIVSNDTPRLKSFLEKNGLSEYFETIVISGIVGVEKPDAHILRIALEQTKARAQDCLYVGDHPFDVLCAKTAGMHCAWIAPPQARLPEGLGAEEDFRINSVEEILAWID